MHQLQTSVLYGQFVKMIKLEGSLWKENQKD